MHFAAFILIIADSTQDVLIAVGLIVGKRATGEGLGQDFCGTVTSIGSDVKTLRLGDRVIGGSTGTFSSRMLIPEKLCIKIPDRMPAVQGATMPVVYCTAIYCFEDIVKLSKDKVHVRCGQACHIFTNVLYRRFSYTLPAVGLGSPPSKLPNFMDLR